MRAYITKSRSGHYTLTIRDLDYGQLIYISEKLGSKEEAQRMYLEIKSTGAKK